MQTGMQTIFPGQFPKAFENTALRNTAFHDRYRSDSLQAGNLKGGEMVKILLSVVKNNELIKEMVIL